MIEVGQTEMNLSDETWEKVLKEHEKDKLLFEDFQIDLYQAYSTVNFMPYTLRIQVEQIIGPLSVSEEQIKDLE